MGLRKVTIKMMQQINELYDMGYNMKMIAEKVGVSSSLVCNYIWNPRKSGTKTEIRL